MPRFPTPWASEHLLPERASFRLLYRPGVLYLVPPLVLSLPNGLWGQHALTPTCSVSTRLVQCNHC